ncbi:MAG: YkgJ family cysteine cluster protein [Nitrospinae bacterium]|nr:YkgJ family cysteine cluster protein [Nitrospinota bacterium]
MRPEKEKATCEGCPALCCYGVEHSIPPPRTKTEEDDLVWQLHFTNTRFFIRSRRWYMIVHGGCRYLNENNRCTIYARRPDVCREHNPPDCEYFFEIFDVMFETPEKLQRYFDNRRKKRGAGQKGRA